MLFYCSKPENKDKFMKSIERMICASYPDFKINDKFYNMTVEDFLKYDYSLADITGGILDIDNIDEVYKIASKYVNKINLESFDKYEEDTIERQLAIIKDNYEIYANLSPMYKREKLEKIYKKIF